MNMCIFSWSGDVWGYPPECSNRVASTVNSKKLQNLKMEFCKRQTNTFWKFQPVYSLSTNYRNYECVYGNFPPTFSYSSCWLHVKLTKQKSWKSSLNKECLHHRHSALSFMIKPLKIFSFTSNTAVTSLSRSTESN